MDRGVGRRGAAVAVGSGAGGAHRIARGVEAPQRLLRRPGRGERAAERVDVEVEGCGGEEPDEGGCEQDHGWWKKVRR